MALKLFQETKLYEAMFLFDSNLASKDWTGLERHVQDLFRKSSADLVYAERWPDRKLCYEIKGAKKGTYYLVYFKAPPRAIQGLTRDCELSERILRVLFLYDEELVKDCEKRLSREVTGSPEEIEEQKERSRRESEAGAGAPSFGEEPKEKPLGDVLETAPGGESEDLGAKIDEETDIKEGAHEVDEGGDAEEDAFEEKDDRIGR